MFNVASSPNSIGLERTSSAIKGASVSMQRKKNICIKLFTIQPELDNVKQLYNDHPIISTALDGKETLIRSMHLPLTKDKDIEAALSFQAEPLLPYAVDQALLAFQVISKSSESSDVTLYAVKKETIQSHLDLWKALHIEPENVASIPSALCSFGAFYLTHIKSYLILHVNTHEMTCVLIQDGKLLASYSKSEGLETLFKAQTEENISTLPQSPEGWQHILQNQNSPLAQTLKRLQNEVVKMTLALAKELKGEEIEGILVTGSGNEWEGFNDVLVQSLQTPLLSCTEKNYSSKELLSYALPIGLALGALPRLSHSINFRQQELSYPHQWKRLLKPMTMYFILVCLLSLAFSFFGNQFLLFREDQIRQKYIDLLATMNKSYEHFESTYQAKISPKAPNDELPKLSDLAQEDLKERLSFLQKELQATPDSFPLFANIPRVSDVFAWLSQHPNIIFLDDEGNRESRLYIENFSYMMLKRPQHGKKQDKYQVKIELEFSSPTPKWAREFHDALIAPNDWVDPKGEVKWSSNRGKYKTSFFLKDKTVYPSG